MPSTEKKSKRGLKVWNEKSLFLTLNTGKGEWKMGRSPRMWFLVWGLVLVPFVAFGQSTPGPADQGRTGSEKNQGIISQIGDYSIAEQYQRFVETAPNYAYIEQVGGKHSASQTQDGNANTAAIYQYISENSAIQRQMGANNTALIRQDGTQNIATQEQYTGPYIETMVLNGLGNETYRIRREGWGNFAEIAQYGARNIARQNQESAYGAVAKISQEGTSNQAIQIQTMAIGTVAIVSQVGSNNYSYQMQSGYGHMSTVFQNGTANTATVIQKN
jgi:hypothetical protein